MRVTPTVTVSCKDVCAAIIILIAGSMTICCLWILISGSARRSEQQLGSKIQHRQKGLTLLKNITRHVSKVQKSKQRIVDPPVDNKPAMHWNDEEEEDDEDEEEREELFINPELNRRMYREELALRDVSKLTSASKSVYWIEGEGRSFQQGETLRVTIRARDGRGTEREAGGDFWFVTLTNKRNTSGAAGRVLDHGNGTYSARLPLGWAGPASLEVTLVHPSAVASALTEVVWGEPGRAQWSGRFEKHHHNHHRHQQQQQPPEEDRPGEEAAGRPGGPAERRCVLRRQDAPRPGECSLANRRALGQTTLVCAEPGRGMTCEDLVALSVNHTAIRESIRRITRSYFNVFSGDHFRRRLMRGPSQIFIKESAELRQAVMSGNRASMLPACGPDHSPAERGRGFWANNTWQPWTCGRSADARPRWTERSSAAVVGECLRGKRVYLLGDRPTRAWMATLLTAMGQPSPGQADSYSGGGEEPQEVSLSVEAFNATVTSWLNPLVLERPGGTRRRRDRPVLTLEADVLDALGGGGAPCDGVVVVVSAWAGFAHWPRPSYEEYAALLAGAAAGLRRRCPDATVAVAGPHPREQPGKESRVYHSDLIGRRMGEVMEGALSRSESGALYLDTWDLNLGYPASKALVMPVQVIRAELSLILSYVCG